MDLLTERPATQLMEECMTGIMKVGLLSALLPMQGCVHGLVGSWFAPRTSCMTLFMQPRRELTLDQYPDSKCHIDRPPMCLPVADLQTFLAAGARGEAAPNTIDPTLLNPWCGHARQTCRSSWRRARA